MLTAAAATYYTTPANSATTVSACSVTNTSATARTVTVYLVPTGGAAGPENAVCSARTVAPGETFNVPGAIAQTIPAGATLQAMSDAGGALSLVASGYVTI